MASFWLMARLLLAIRGTNLIVCWSAVARISLASQPASQPVYVTVWYFRASWSPEKPSRWRNEEATHFNENYFLKLGPQYSMRYALALKAIELHCHQGYVLILHIPVIGTLLSIGGACQPPAPWMRMTRGLGGFRTPQYVVLWLWRNITGLLLENLENRVWGLKGSVGSFLTITKKRKAISSVHIFLLTIYY